MALQFDEYVFFHIPRCGGNFVRRLVKHLEDDNRIDLHTEEIGSVHCTPLNVEVDVLAGNTSFCVLRDPLTWYKSYFGYRLLKGFKKNHYIDSKCSATSFNDFVRTMTMAFPYGCYAQLVSMITPYVDYIIPLSQLTNQCFINMNTPCRILLQPKITTPASRTLTYH
jgi:hypothetical protein